MMERCKAPGCENRWVDEQVAELDSTTGTFNPPGDLDLVPVAYQIERIIGTDRSDVSVHESDDVIWLNFDSPGGVLRGRRGLLRTLIRRRRANRYVRISLIGRGAAFRFRHRAKRRGGR